MKMKRSCTGLSKPNCFSISLMNSGSSPWAPRYLLVMTPPAPSPTLGMTWPPEPTSAPVEPPMRAVAPTTLPLIWAMICSTGPPGANCTTTKLTTMMPNSVGIMSKRRRIR